MANYVSYSDATELMTAIGNKLSGKVDTSDVGSANGVAELDANGRVPSSQLPSYVDDVLEYADLAHFPATGETGKIYIAEDTNKTYRWSGLGYAEISESLALGETSSTAYAGNKGKANADAIAAIKDGANIDSFGDVETALAGKANSSDLGDKSNLTTTDKSSVVGAINEVKSGLTNITHTGNIPNHRSESIAGSSKGNVRLIVIKRASIEVAAVVLVEYWSDALVVVYGSLPESITITKSTVSNDIVIANESGSSIAYLVIN